MILKKNLLSVFECVNLRTCEVINLPVDTLRIFDNLGDIYQHILNKAKMNSVCIPFHYDFGAKYYEILWYKQGKAEGSKYAYLKESTSFLSVSITLYLDKQKRRLYACYSIRKKSGAISSVKHKY